MEIISVEQLDELKDAIKEAEKDDTPYIGIKDDELHVLGDPNKTEVKAADYVVCFAFPNTDKWRARAEANEDEIGGLTKDKRYFLATRKYRDIYLSPRRATGAISALAEIESFIYQVSENGELKELTYDEKRQMLAVMDGDLSDATYRLVATVLRIPYDEVEWMLPLNTMENAVKIALNNPSAVNEADLFFDLPH